MHDVIIIGAGPAGMAAAFWCDDLGLDTLVLERSSEVGGQLLSIYNPIQNYLGVDAANGRELRDRFRERLDEGDFDLWTEVEIDNVELAARRVTLRSGESLQAIAIVVATGVRRRSLGVAGEAEFAERGVIESATRDHELFSGKDVCVIGGGDAAAENALLLSEVCPTVTVVCRSKQLRARREFAEQLQPNHRITVFPESVVTRIIGEDEVQAVEISRRGALKPFQVAVQGVLIRIGVEPNSELFSDQIRMDEKGYVIVNGEQETSIENVFAIGDVANPRAPTIAGAVGSGATAAKVIASRLTRPAPR